MKKKNVTLYIYITYKIIIIITRVVCAEYSVDSEILYSCTYDIMYVYLTYTKSQSDEK